MAPLRKIFLEDILELKAQGLNQWQIAEKLNCSQAGISRVCTDNGVYWDIGAAARDQTGDRNPRFTNGLSRSTIERLTRSVILKSGRSLHVCERCLEPNHQEQHRHHKDRDRSNNESHNIEVLCPTCHRLEHEKDMVRDAKTGQYVCKSQS